MIHFLFIDAAVKNFDSLQANVNPETIVHRIGNNVDGVDYITQTLVAQKNGSKNHGSSDSDITVSIVANGSPGVLSLGNAVLNLASLNRYRDRIKQWFSGTPLNLGHHDRLQVYAHDGVANAEGQELLHGLHQITYATVYAFSPKIAHAQQWVNWQFDTLVNTWNTRLVPLLGYAQSPAPQSPFNTKNLMASSRILTAPIGDMRGNKVLPK